MARLDMFCSMSVYVVATLDTKGREADFVRDLLQQRGLSVRLVDAGCVGEPAVEADLPRSAVFAAGGVDLGAMRERGDRGAAIGAAARGVQKIVVDAHARGEVAGVFGLGGSAGTTIATAAMRALPIGVPKVMVSTLASGQVRQYVGDKDITMINSVVDILGIHRISRVVLGNAAAAMAGMVLHPQPAREASDRPLVAATMFGVTTPCVERAREVLEGAGFEVLVFHATGTGGQAMESLVREGAIAGVLDVTTTEIADELFGGELSAGPSRLTAAAESGVPQVVSVGATDMVNFFGKEAIPAHVRHRTFYEHNPNVNLMRTTAEECAAIGADLAAKVARSTAPAAIYLPTRGVSTIDCEGQPFDDPDARSALFAAIRAGAGSIPVTELDCHLNDPEFAEALAARLVALIAQDSGGSIAAESTPPTSHTDREHP